MWGNDVWAPTPPPTAPWAPPGLTPHPPPGIRINNSVLDESTDLGGEIDVSICVCACDKMYYKLL